MLGPKGRQIDETDVRGILSLLEKLEQAKDLKVEEIIRHSEPRRLISDEIRNETVLALMEELRDIEKSILQIRTSFVKVNSNLHDAIMNAEELLRR